MECRILLVFVIIQSDCILLRTVAAATSSQENNSCRSAPGKGKSNKQFIASQFNLFTLPEALSEARTTLQMCNRINVSRLMLQRENLSKANLVIDSLIKEFNPEKGEFDKFTNYIHNRQGTDKTWSRSFIQVYLNEKRDLFLTSNYYRGQWLNHNALSIEGEGLSAKTDSVPIDNVNNHHSEFSGSKWEKVTYHGELTDKVIALIAVNPKKS